MANSAEFLDCANLLLAPTGAHSQNDYKTRNSGGASSEICSQCDSASRLSSFVGRSGAVLGTSSTAPPQAGRPPASIGQAAAALSTCTPASFQGGLLTSQGDARKEAWDLFARRLDLCRELGIGVLVVACDIAAPISQQDIDRARLSLKQAAQEAVATLVDRGVNPLAKNKKIWDFGGGMGGPIVKDKVWFYTAHRWWGAQNFQPATSFNTTPHTPFYNPDPSRPTFTDFYNQDNSIRFTVQASERNKLTLSQHFQTNCACNFWTQYGVTGSSRKGH